MSALSYPAFLQLLSETPRDWYLDDGAIRRMTALSSCCPLTAVEPCHVPPIFARLAADAIGVDRETAVRIIVAADNRSGHDPQVRADLLAACGLTERAE